jgi:hypothetical protein
VRNRRGANLAGFGAVDSLADGKAVNPPVAATQLAASLPVSSQSGKGQR